MNEANKRGAWPVFVPSRASGGFWSDSSQALLPAVPLLHRLVNGPIGGWRSLPGHLAFPEAGHDSSDVRGCG